MENLKERNLEYETVGEFLADPKKKFGKWDNKIIKIAEFKKVEWENRMIEKFVQEFKKVVRRSGHKRRLLVGEFNRGMNRVIKWKLMKVERSPRDIKQ